MLKLFLFFLFSLPLHPIGASELPICEFVRLELQLMGIPFHTFGENEIKSVVVHNEAGQTNRGLFEVKINSQDAIVKRLSFSSDSSPKGIQNESDKFIKEVKFSKEFSDLGLAPQFLGISILDGKSLGLIYKKISPSWFLNVDPDASANQAKLARDGSDVQTRILWAKKIKNITEEITKRKIRALDLQFLLEPSGEVFVIDFGHYSRTDDNSALAKNRIDAGYIIEQIYP